MAGHAIEVINQRSEDDDPPAINAMMAIFVALEQARDDLRIRAVALWRRLCAAIFDVGGKPAYTPPSGSRAGTIPSPTSRPAANTAGRPGGRDTPAATGHETVSCFRCFKSARISDAYR